MNRPLRVLMVEDCASDAKLVLRALQQRGRVIDFDRVAAADTMRTALTEKGWDLVLSDWSMPGFSARAALDVLHEKSLDLPFIIVSGTIGEETAVDAMRAGAHDYVQKDKLGRLLPAVERELRECKARAAHRESEARRAMMLESALDAIIGMDHIGRITDWNAAAERLFGYSRAETQGRDLSELIIPPALREAHKAGLARQVSTGESRLIGKRIEIEALRRDGTLIAVELAISRMGTTTPPSFMGFVRDVSERKRAERAREESEARYRRIVESTNQGIWMIDLDGRTTFMNARMAAMVGYERDEVIGTPSRMFVATDWRDQTARNVGEKRARQLESMLERKDGTTVWALLDVAPMFGDTGAHEGWFAMVTDVTERRRSAEALRVSELEKERAQNDVLERVRIEALTAEMGLALALGASLPDILRRCAEAMVTHLDVALAQIWALKVPEGVMELQATSGMDNAKFDIDLIARTREPYFTNDFATCSFNTSAAWAGREELVAFAGHPLRVAGQQIGYLALFARHALSTVVEKGLASLAGAIAVGIQRKTAEAAGAALEVQLRQAQKMDAIGRLAGGIAHDFNNVLSVILSYGDLILDDLKPGDSLRPDMEEIKNAALRAASLTRQLVMFSRQQVVQPKVLDLNELLSGTDKMLRRLVGEDVELSTIAGASLGRVCADPGSVDQVIMNLVVNARDAMPTGGRITVETANVELDEAYADSHFGAKAGPYVMLSVTDTGCGMDSATLARIFEPFFTTKDVGKGTGIGLSTVFGIVQQSGGNISVRSELGIGTTFEVYLPRVEALTEPPDVDRAPTTLRGTETILLVEDEDQVRTVTRGILRRHGYTVIEARSAAEAVPLSATYVGPIHLLLSDVVMPGMSGPVLARTLVQSRPDMRLLCMSGYTDDAAVRHGVLDTHLAYLQKPISVVSLTKKVRSVLDAKR